MQIYKICPRAEFERQKLTGTFKGHGIDERDGYIHFSTRELTQETLQLWFKGQSDLVVFSVESDNMPNLKWEEARGGSLFPHVYGEFPFSEVIGLKDVSVSESGVIEGL